ncbi:GapA-binding peptide SR1P [Alkalihalobacillus alcalophilus]
MIVMLGTIICQTCHESIMAFESEKVTKVYVKCSHCSHCQKNK